MKYNPRQCRATSCDVEITTKMVFCERHWGILPGVNKQKMIDNFDGEWDIMNQPDLAWAKSVLEAIKLLELLDAQANLKARRKSYGNVDYANTAHAATDEDDEVVDEDEGDDTPEDLESGDPW